MPLFLSVSKVGICACAVLLGCFIMAVDGTSCLDFEGGSKIVVRNIALEDCADLCLKNSANCTTYAYQPEKSRCKYFDQVKTTVGGEGWTVYHGCNATENLVSGPNQVNDSEITASDYYTETDNYQCAPKWARLTTVAPLQWTFKLETAGSWMADTADVEHWIQVELKQDAVITAVATRGRGQEPHNQWVTAYNVSVSMDGTNWTPVSAENGQTNFVGNTEKWNIVENALETPTVARFVRFYPTEWNDWVSMGFDVQGCSHDTAEL